MDGGGYSRLLHDISSGQSIGLGGSLSSPSGSLQQQREAEMARQKRIVRATSAKPRFDADIADVPSPEQR